MAEIKLKPCPFCGQEGKMRINPSTLNCSANCPNCEVVMKRNFKRSKKVEETLAMLMTEAWNQRVADAQEEE